MSTKNNNHEIIEPWLLDRLKENQVVFFVPENAPHRAYCLYSHALIPDPLDELLTLIIQPGGEVKVPLPTGYWQGGVDELVFVPQFDKESREQYKCTAATFSQWCEAQERDTSDPESLRQYIFGDEEENAKRDSDWTNTQLGTYAYTRVIPFIAELHAPGVYDGEIRSALTVPQRVQNVFTRALEKSYGEGNVCIGKQVLTAEDAIRDWKYLESQGRERLLYNRQFRKQCYDEQVCPAQSLYVPMFCFSVTVKKTWGRCVNVEEYKRFLYELQRRYEQNFNMRPVSLLLADISEDAKLACNLFCGRPSLSDVLKMYIEDSYKALCKEDDAARRQKYKELFEKFLSRLTGTQSRG